MALITQEDFETTAGQKKIIQTIHNLEVRVRELDRLVHECIEQESRLERDLERFD